MKMKKLVTAMAIALVGTGATYAATPSSSISPLEEELATLLEKFTGPVVTVAGTATNKVGPDISVLSGAINVAALNGSINLQGTDVSLSSMASDVSAKAEAIADNATATAYAIAGARLSTTVIGSMNSATVDVMSRTEDLMASVNSVLNVGSLAGDGTNTGVASPAVDGGFSGLTGALSAGNLLSSSGAVKLDDLVSSMDLMGSSKINELQTMNVFNAAINTAALDASINITAKVDPDAWFLNPQTGIVNLSNIEMSTTNIGAMNSSLTRLGVNLAR